MGMKAFYEAMRRELPPGGRIVMSQFRGDPYKEIRGKWRVIVLNDLAKIDHKANVYLCVSAMGKNARGEFRRRKENFAGGLLLMIDDLGDGPGAKFPLSTIDDVPPSALIETSPENYQAIYLFEKLVTDMATFDALIRAFINAKFIEKDPGMAGVNRVFRPPAGVNGKPKYGGNFEVRLAGGDLNNRYTPEGLASAFGLTLKREGPRLARGRTADKAANIRAFIAARQSLRAAGMLKSEEPDLAGWIPIYCPWTDGHTGGADNGAAIRIPEEENGFFGAFKCHHGSCAEYHWRDLTDWMAEEQAQILDTINELSPRRIP